MKIYKKLSSTALFILFLIVTVSSSWAQRNVDYRELAMKNRQQPVSFDVIALPGDKENTVRFTSVFSLSYSYLPFKKMSRTSSGNNYYSTVSLSLEVFKAENSSIDKKKENISIEGLEPAGRSFWSDTAFAKTYEMSQSNNEFLKGYLNITLEPGSYNYVLQMKRGEQTDSRISRAQFVRIEPYEDMKTGNIILGNELMEDRQTPRFQLNSMGNAVEYAKDFYALAYIPKYDSESTYTLKVNSLQVAEDDTSKESQTYTKTLTSDDIRTGLRPAITSSENKTYVNLNSSDNGFAYALVKIPNSNFPNSFYRIIIEKEGEQAPVSEGKFRSLWMDMPASLLNLDVAIDMLHYITDKETIKKLSSGSQSEREKKFRAFWKQRDPTPKTEYNELMAEYYRRIDYAYEHFTTETRIGYESDQGKIYIKFGPPQDIDRKFPSNGPTTEIWTYPDRKFIFRATSGFGDFKLVSDQSK